ncbi:MAG: serine/threonine-protein phosphatase [Lachnospiraceae bacterium]|nr:serine/threonine-protein phosphatase [Lachnospiraceae bacterium]
MFSYAGKVDIGVYEKGNDDRLLIGPHLLTGGSFAGKTQQDHIMAVVCDGVGGMAEGGRAAMTALELFSHLDRPGVTQEEIREAVETANSRCRNLQSIENLHNGLRTTIAGIYADKDRFLVFNAGDSRVYRFRYRFFSQLSRDHSLVQDMVDLGEISPEMAKTHPKKNIINKCIGNAETVVPRIVDLTEDFVKDDIIMICSDGISDEVEDAEFRELIMEHKQDESLEECCGLICRMAIAKGSKDNMSVILLRREGE